jgi:hypothetical protein
MYELGAVKIRVIYVSTVCPPQHCMHSRTELHPALWRCESAVVQRSSSVNVACLCG